MELFLNLLWLLLAIPAVWLWAHRPISSHGAKATNRLRVLVLMGCVLALLFPVVSATDDLHAMRPEAEECVSSKRAVKHFAGAKSKSCLGAAESPAETTQIDALVPDNEFGQVLIHRRLMPSSVTTNIRAGRAPPTSFI